MFKKRSLFFKCHYINVEMSVVVIDKTWSSSCYDKKKLSSSPRRQKSQVITQKFELGVVLPFLNRGS